MQNPWPRAFDALEEAGRRLGGKFEEDIKRNVPELRKRTVNIKYSGSARLPYYLCDAWRVLVDLELPPVESESMSDEPGPQRHDPSFYQWYQAEVTQRAFMIIGLCRHHINVFVTRVCWSKYKIGTNLWTQKTIDRMICVNRNSPRILDRSMLAAQGTGDILFVQLVKTETCATDRLRDDNVQRGDPVHHLALCLETPVSRHSKTPLEIVFSLLLERNVEGLKMCEYFGYGDVKVLAGFMAQWVASPR